MQDSFLELAEALLRHKREPETFLLCVSGEHTDFVSVSQQRIRQALRVDRVVLSVRLIEQGRHAAWRVALSGDRQTDVEAGMLGLERLRELLPRLPVDPFLSLPAKTRSTDITVPSSLPPIEVMVDDFLRAGEGEDVVGILAAGTLFAGFASSTGQRNWFQRASFTLDWSVYTEGRPATKHTLAGLDWDGSAPERQMGRPGGFACALAGQSRTLAPGRYRAYFAPTAVRELLGLASMDGFSARAWRKGTGCFARVVRGQHLSNLITWHERPDVGVGPSFDCWGFEKPELTLFEAGQPRQPLVSPRSAVEFGLPCTGAGEWEQPQSLVMSPGDVPAADVPNMLGTGVWITHLHYLNPTDFAAGRFTGLTRFATVWVENGEPVHPVEVVRINDSFLEVFGPRLIGLTREREFLLDTATMEGRSTRLFWVPGALVDGVSLG